MKPKIRGARNFIAGFLTCALIFSLVTVVSAQARTRQATITYDNIRVVIDGQEAVLRDLQGNRIEPFIMDGTMYVPISPLVRQFGKTSVYDANTRTLFIGQRPPETVPFLRTTPAFDVSNSSRVQIRDSVMMGGTRYDNAIIYQVGSAAWTHRTGHSLHNLHAQYTRLTGYIGRLDGTGQHGATFNFIGDGEVIATYELRALDLPQRITVNVTGVRNLRIQVAGPQSGVASTTYAFANGRLEG